MDKSASSESSRFDALAKQWDVAPMHLERTRDVAALLRSGLDLSGKEALEVGAGTGLLSFALAGDLGRILATDPSAGMVEVLQEKIARGGIGNLHARRCDDTLLGVEGPFDLVMSQMALHHSADVPGFLSRTFALLAEGGTLAVADLDTEDGSFHGPDVRDVHHGFDREDLGRKLAKAGFSDVRFSTAHVMRREVEGRFRDYPIFLCLARRAPG